MMTFYAALLLMSTGMLSSDGHNALDAEFRELRRVGVSIGDGQKAVLPEPTLADGLDDAAQKVALRKLGGDEKPLEDLVYRSLVAPHILKIRDVAPSDPKAPAYGVDLWFVAYGDLDVLMKREPRSFLGAGRKDIESHILTMTELTQRKLPPPAAGGPKQQYVHNRFPLLDRVEIAVTTLSMATHTKDSLVVASRLDPSFADDPQFPNQWREILPEDVAGKPAFGPPHTYHGSASYLKVTRLREPSLALFVEYHSVSIEPNDWFHGANLLRTKLPIAIQSEVRAFRRETIKTLPAE